MGHLITPELWNRAHFESGARFEPCRSVFTFVATKVGGFQCEFLHIAPSVAGMPSAATLPGEPPMPESYAGRFDFVFEKKKKKQIEEALREYVRYGSRYPSER